MSLEAALEQALDPQGQPSPAKVIYLAETTPDLNEDREKIRRELEQAGHRVLPEAPCLTHPPLGRPCVNL